MDYLIVGKNIGWKGNSDMGRKNNRAFHALAHTQLVNYLKYKALLFGIVVLVTEESYTSQSSFKNTGDLPVYDQNRVKTKSRKQIRKEIKAQIAKDNFNHISIVNLAKNTNETSKKELNKCQAIKLATIQNGKNDIENAQIAGVLTSSPVNPTTQKRKKQNAFKGQRKNRDDYVNDAPKTDKNQLLADIANPIMSKKDFKNIVHADINASYNMMRKIFSQAQYNPRKHRFNYHIVALQAQKIHVKYLS